MLGTGQLTVIELEPVEVVEAAAGAGLDAVSLFLNSPGPQSRFPLTTASNAGAVRSALTATGIRLMNIECFMLTPATDVGAFRAALELGASLGARNATALLYDNDAARLRENLAALHDLAHPLGVDVAIEFMPFTPTTKTLSETVTLIDSMRLPGLRVAVDCLHLIRSGGTVGELAGVRPDLFAHVQVCDSLSLEPGERYFEEAGAHRLTPGEGCFPLTELIGAVPPSVYLELEVPQQSTTPAPERLMTIVAAARALIQAAGRQ